jgi:hypothetical protein
VSLVPSADSGPVSAAFAELLHGYAREPIGDAWFRPGRHDDFARELSAGGWLACGGKGDGTGDGAVGLADLLELAELWGARLIPLPFSASVVLARWSSAPDEDPPWRTAAYLDRDGTALVAHPERGPVAGLAEPDWTPDSDAALDRFAPSLPLATASAPASDAAADWRRELTAMLAAECVGAARMWLTRSIDYSRVRETYGQPIGSYQAIQYLLVDLYRDIEFAKSAALWAGQTADPTQSARAALSAVRLARTGLQAAIQVHGGVGFTWELGLHFQLRHVMTVERLLLASAEETR